MPREAAFLPSRSTTPPQTPGPSSLLAPASLAAPARLRQCEQQGWRGGSGERGEREPASVEQKQQQQGWACVRLRRVERRSGFWRAAAGAALIVTENQSRQNRVSIPRPPPFECLSSFNLRAGSVIPDPRVPRTCTSAAQFRVITVTARNIQCRDSRRAERKKGPRIHRPTLVCNAGQLHDRFKV